jgi:hypothetical protein
MEQNIVFWNPWWESDTFDPKLQHRQSFDEIEPYLFRKEVLFFSGVRRSGKTSLMYYLITNLLDDVSPKNILYLNLDDQVLRFETLEDIFDTYKKIFPEVKDKKYVFLDEIQNVDDWEVFVKNKYDSMEDIKFIISGSKSHLLKRKSSLLTGRMFEREIFPLSFIEFLNFKEFNISKLNVISKKNILLKLFYEYLKFGGFPEVVFESSERLKVSLLQEYFENIKDKDIITFFNIKEIKKFDRLCLFLISNISKPFSASKIGSFVGLSTQVIGDYLDYSELMYLFLSLNHFNYSLKSQISMPRKFYSIDPGVSNAISFRFSEDSGRLLENLVFLDLKRQEKEIYYHKDKSECDFVIKQGLKVAEAIQVCYELNEDNKKREINGLVEACTTHKLKKGLLLTYDQEDSFQKDGVKITVKPVWKWLLE